MKHILEYNTFINSFDSSYNLTESYEDYENPEAAKIVNWSKNLIVKNLSFFGSIISLLPVYEVSNKNICKTMATSGTFIMYNPDFVMYDLKGDIKQVTFVLLHEVLHVVLDHIGRQKEAKLDPYLSNVAADYSINPMIIDVDRDEKVKSKTGYNKARSIVDKKGDIMGEFPDSILYTTEFKDLDFLYIYDLLKNDDKYREHLPKHDKWNIGEHDKKVKVPKGTPDYEPNEKEEPEEVDEEQVKEILEKLAKKMQDIRGEIYQLDKDNSEVWRSYVFEELTKRFNTLVRLSKECNDELTESDNEVYVNHYRIFEKGVTEIRDIYSQIGKHPIPIVKLNQIKSNFLKLKTSHDDAFGEMELYFDSPEEVHNKTEKIDGIINDIIEIHDITERTTARGRNGISDSIKAVGRNFESNADDLADLADEYSEAVEEPNEKIITLVGQYIVILKSVSPDVVSLGGDLMKSNKKTDDVYEGIQEILNIFKNENDDQSGDQGDESEQGQQGQSQQGQGGGDSDEKDENEGDYEKVAAGENGEDEDGEEGDSGDKEKESNKEKGKGKKGEGRDKEDQINDELKKEGVGDGDGDDEDGDGGDGDDGDSSSGKGKKGKGKGKGGNVGDLGGSGGGQDNFDREDDSELAGNIIKGGRKKIDSRIKSIVREAIRGRGTGSMGLDQTIQRIFRSKRDWKKELRDFLDAMNEAPELATFPKRRYASRRLYISDFEEGEEGMETMYILVDTSGSVSDKMLEKFSDEINKISKDIEIERTVIVNFDGKIHEPPQIFEKGKEIGIEKFAGRGGTDIPLAFKWIEKKHEKYGEPSAVLMFTDGYDIFPKKFKFADKTLWVIMNNENTQGNFGKTLNILPGDMDD